MKRVVLAIGGILILVIAVLGLVFNHSSTQKLSLTSNKSQQTSPKTSQPVRNNQNTSSSKPVTNYSAQAKQDQAQAQQDINQANQSALNSQQQEAALNSQQQQLNTQYQQDVQQSQQEQQSLNSTSTNSQQASTPPTPVCNTTAEAQDQTAFENAYINDRVNAEQYESQQTGGAAPNINYNDPQDVAAASYAYYSIFLPDWNNLKLQWVSEMEAINCTSPPPSETGVLWPNYIPG